MVARAGRRHAVATGDLLFSRAFAELGSQDGSRQVESLTAASVALALGELAQRRDAYDTSITVERYFERCRLKTGRLFECACVIGRSTGVEEDPALPSLASFGREIGLAFQLLDDVLDVAGPPERTGKALGTDLLDGTMTLPFILAREEDPQLASLDLRSLDVAGAERVCERISSTAALEEVRRRAAARIAAAKDELAAASLADEDRRLLGLVADGVVQRYA